MQGLTHLVQDEVGDIDQVVVGVQTDCAQVVLHPLGRGSNLCACDGYARITGSTLGVNYLNGNIQIVVIYCKSLNRRFAQLAFNTICRQIGCQVASHTIVRHCVCAVGGKTDTDAVVLLDVEVLFGGSSGNSLGGQNHNAVVTFADTEFILGTQHTERLYATDFALFDFETFGLADGVENGTDGCAHHLLAGCHVGRAAYDL